MVDTVESVQDEHVCIKSFNSFSTQAVIVYDLVDTLATNAWLPTDYNDILNIPDYSIYVVITKRVFEQLNLGFDVYQ